MESFPEVDEVQIVTFPVHTDIDASQLLDIIIELRAQIEDEILTYGHFARILDEEISVESGDSLLGGE
jgi:hypothetical protein